MSRKGYKIVLGVTAVIVVGFSVAVAQLSSDFALKTTLEKPGHARSVAALSNISGLDTQTRAREGTFPQTQIGDSIYGAKRKYLVSSALSNNFSINTMEREASSRSQAKLSASTLSAEFTLDTTRRTPSQ